MDKEIRIQQIDKEIARLEAKLAEIERLEQNIFHLKLMKATLVLYTPPITFYQLTSAPYRHCR